MAISDPSGWGVKPRYRYLPLVFVLYSLLTSCVTLKDPEGFQLHHAAVIGSVDPQNSIGQSFVSRRGSFNGIDLWLGIDPESQARDGTLLIELYRNPDQNDLIASVPLSFNGIFQGQPVYISFPTQTSNPGQNYYLSMSTVEGGVQVFGRAEDAYPHGSAYHNNQQVDADAAFRLSYDYGLDGILTDIARFLQDAWLFFPLVFVLFVPGWLLFDLTGLGKNYDFGAQIAISIGTSLALIPIVMTWTTLIGFNWSRTTFLILAGLLCAIAFWRIWDTKAWRGIRLDWHGYALLGIFVLTLAVRLAMVRDLFAPAWVDSVHHGVITRLIIEKGGFPSNYAPFLAIESANYHPGFHSVLASFTWLSDLEIQSGMLTLGQVLNALMIFGTYLFTVTLTRSRSAGVIASLITGLITPMPAYYSSWGRYTQLTGLIILPVAFAIIKQGYISRYDVISDHEYSGLARLFSDLIRKNWPLFLLGGISVGGLFLTHYRVSAFLLCLVIADLISQTRPQFKKGATRYDFFWQIIYLLVIGVLGIFLVFPWLPPTFRTLLIPKVQTWRGGNIRLFDGFSWVFLESALGRYGMALAAVGMVWAIIKRRWFSLTLLLWILLLFFLANLAYWNLPGSVLINNLSVEIILFIPISVLGGYAVSEILKAGMLFMPLRWQKWYFFGIAITSIAIGIIGSRQLLPLLNPITFLFREADKKALNWLGENTPTGETIVINPFAWGYGLYAGQDGGYWASPIAGRGTIPPPVLYGLSNTPEDTQRINTLIQQIIENGDNPENLYQMMTDAGIQYLFTGVRGGVISPQALKDSPLFELIYQADGASTFKAVRNP